MVQNNGISRTKLVNPLDKSGAMLKHNSFIKILNCSRKSKFTNAKCPSQDCDVGKNRTLEAFWFPIFWQKTPLIFWYFWLLIFQCSTCLKGSIFRLYQFEKSTINSNNSFWGVPIKFRSEGIAQNFVQKRSTFNHFFKNVFFSVNQDCKLFSELNAKISFQYFVSSKLGGNFKENGYRNFSNIIGTFKKIHVVVKLWTTEIWNFKLTSTLYENWDKREP